MIPFLRTCALAVFIAASVVGSVLAAQSAPPVETWLREDLLLNWLNGIAQQQLQKRDETIRGIHSREAAEVRKQLVRRELLEDIGGLPDYGGPLHARITGKIQTDSYTIEKVVYESLPGFYVTANLYRPNRPGRYPAVLLQSGHTQEGKPENQLVAANLAMKGFVVLCFDPIGQGERVQTYSRISDRPLAGWSVPEHIIMDAQAQLIGQGLARYFVWDAMRSLDYLASRPEVDASRIGAAGCSGGGALTTFIGALDPRIKVVIPACFPSSLQKVFPTPGNHGEMLFPHMLHLGLDTADFVELTAPTPWLLQATEVDQYGFDKDGVRQVYEEARNWYGLYHAQENVGFMVGPGNHGMPLVSREAVYQWMIRWLKNGEGDFHEQQAKLFTNDELRVTDTGLVEDLPGSRKVFEVLRDELKAKKKQGSRAELLAELAKLGVPSGKSAPAVRVLGESKDANSTRQHIQLESEPELWIDADLYLPLSAGKKPAVVIVNGKPASNSMMPARMAEEIVKQGRVVLKLEPRYSQQSSGLGTFTGAWARNMQAGEIGRNLPAMRAHDILRGVDMLSSRQDVDAGSIRAAARGVAGEWLLMAAAADTRIQKIWIDRTPYSLREALDNSVASELSDAVLSGFALHWDLRDLVEAMEIREVLWTDPTNWVERVVALGPPYRYRYVDGDLTDEMNVQNDSLIRELLR